MVPSYAGSIAFSHPDCFTPNRRSNGGGPIPSNAVSNGRPYRQTVRAANRPMGGALDPSIFPMRDPMHTSLSPTGAALGAQHDSIAAIVGPLCVPPERVVGLPNAFTNHCTGTFNGCACAHTASGRRAVWAINASCNAIVIALHELRYWSQHEARRRRLECDLAPSPGDRTGPVAPQPLPR